jgi:hypothetical protein
MPLHNLRLVLAIPFLALLCKGKKRQNPRVKYWEIIADNLSKARLELGLRLGGSTGKI